MKRVEQTPLGMRDVEEHNVQLLMAAPRSARDKQGRVTSGYEDTMIERFVNTFAEPKQN